MEKSLNEYIDMEAYDVVSGAQYRALREEFETLQAAAMRLCNVHRWSYGGPETLEALAKRIADERA